MAITELTEQLEALLNTGAGYGQERGRPWVTLTYAQSLDGCIAAVPGRPLALSGHRSLELTHRLRAAHDAILVGIGTVLADNPHLTVRLAEGQHPQPVVVDSRLRIPLEANLLCDHPLSPWIATLARAASLPKAGREGRPGRAGRQADHARQAALEKAGARVLRLPGNSNGQVDLSALLDCLGELGIATLMVEGGAGIITGFLRERLVDLLVLTISPRLVGGIAAVGNLGAPNADSFPRLRHPHYETWGEDLIVWGDLIWER
jgi:3,4-dihydroxy 2-butanone 4-phosphate synthase/GTP cyclohydrolase II